MIKQDRYGTFPKYQTYTWDKTAIFATNMSDIDKRDKSENLIYQSNLKEFIGKPFYTNGLTMILCHSGCAVLSIDFKQQSLRKGDIAIILDLMSLIPIHVSTNFHASIISVTSATCEETEFKITDNRFWDYIMAYPILKTDSEQYLSLCNWFTLMERAIIRSNDELRERVISGNIYAFFLMLQSEVILYLERENKSVIKGRSTSLLSDFDSLVVRHHRKYREVAFYASQLSITPDYLNRLTVTNWKLSAKDYINRRVMLAIKDYLYSTDLSIKCIAANLNYDDPSYMCRFFKKMTGMSPVEFRNKEKYRTIPT